MPTISFSSPLSQINSYTLIRLPKSASTQLPSRGLTMVKGTINQTPFQAALEPDGEGSHWFRLNNQLLKSIKAKVGETLSLEIESTKDWPEPTIPSDINEAITASPKALAMWEDITPMARWDWIRWITSTKQIATRQHRIEVALSKMSHGSRRPCCFNRSECTVPDVSHNGKLLEPIQI